MSALAICLSLTLLLSSRCVTATLSDSNTGPVVRLSYGSFQGNATADLEEFLGIPFAAPPYASYSVFACAYADNFSICPFLKKALGISDLLIQNHL